MRKLVAKCKGEATLDIGPGMANWTPATGRVGVGVMVVVLVGRYTGVALKSEVLVALGVGLEVEVWSNARGVEVFPPGAIFAGGVEVGEAGGKSAGVLALVGVAAGVSV